MSISRGYCLTQEYKSKESRLYSSPPKDANFKYGAHSDFTKHCSVAQQTATRSTRLPLQFTFQSAAVEADSDVSLNKGVTSNILPILQAAHSAATAQPAV
uniref:Uncharacterized protein n=1 Tax=Grammatophora oceanica TaxID=210454 RepID=A0A7S1UUH2_9STRA|mmetsp:Transcript_23946/g.35388  ORF Transcript_23946/g.35388 Transcript_23946/m.35388 type:complete len:100 (+) Transcript_23946:262-561(+)